MRLRDIEREALEHRADDMMELLRHFEKALEKKNLVHIEHAGYIVVVGDIHGDFTTLMEILNRELGKVVDKGMMVFLGDYVDRGDRSLECLYLLMKLKIEYPHNILLLRGNHEPPYNLIPHPHDLPHQALSKYGYRGYLVYKRLMEMFQRLPLTVITDSGLFLVHGGIPVRIPKLEDLETPDFSILEELLWNDPSDEIDEYIPSPRGAGYLFGINITRRFFEANGLKLVIRGHEPCEGFKINHEGGVITVFSRKGFPYFNRVAGYAKISPDFDIERIEDLIVLI
ncbi:MAG: serine/threonine protein phosphatase [Thermoprotei archaeon]|nr:MAG: serine/threonine protein phosphatase [Thermoprotei archaeon]